MNTSNHLKQVNHVLVQHYQAESEQGRLSCRAEAPFHKRVHWASIVGQETVCLPQPDVKFSR